MTDDVNEQLDVLRQRAEQERVERREYEEGEENETWKASKPGDELAGTLIRGEWVSTQYGQTPVLAIRSVTDGKVYDVWMGSAVLRSFVNEEAPKPGAAILITFDGERPVKDNPDRKYKAYTCVTADHDFAHWSESFQKMINREQRAAADHGGNVGATGYGGGPIIKPPVKTDFGPDEVPF